MRQTLTRPARTPGILQPESFGVVRDECERVHAARIVDRRDVSVTLHRQPPGMDVRTDVENAGFGDRRVHGDQIAMVDAEVGAERSPQRVVHAALRQEPFARSSP
jgi:hypothetical protein